MDRYNYGDEDQNDLMRLIISYHGPEEEESDKSGDPPASSRKMHFQFLEDDPVEETMREDDELPF